MNIKSPSSRPTLKLRDISRISSQENLSPNSYNMNSQTNISLMSYTDIQHSVQKTRESTGIQAKFLENKSKIDIKNFTLQDWRSYSILRHGNESHFQKSPHGRRIIVANALRAYSNDIKKLTDYADRVEKIAFEAELKLKDEQENRRIAEDKVISILLIKILQIYLNVKCNHLNSGI